MNHSLAAAQGMRGCCSGVCGQRMGEGSRGLRMCHVFDRGPQLLFIISPIQLDPEEDVLLLWHHSDGR